GIIVQKVTKFRDLLDYYPYRYVDRSKFYNISEFRGEMPLLQVKGQFISFRKEGEGRRRRLVGVFHDGHNMMECVWFSKVDALSDVWQTYKPYVIFGKPTLFNNIWSISHPEVEVYDENRPPVGLQGIYSLTEVMRKRGFTQKMIQTAVRNLIQLPGFKSVSETLPSNIRDFFRFPDICTSYRSLHFPADADSLRRARERMKFEELFYLELQILRYSRDRGRKIAGHLLPHIGSKFNDFYKRCIPFELTGAQKRVLREIRSDMLTGRQMNRLIQGDVGSGKTMVAFMTLLMGIDNGFQCAMMAPTEILATQHYDTMRGWCEKIGLNIRLLTGSTKAKARREIHAGLMDGSIHILVGT
ncbi:MAG: DEAD/DEAH box helicase, partial [Muribaculaceae bacterium]|nr:DEAD/DEAH box helicase [Muribaculaceae bacterium]